jgi:DNA-binding winged helix-turn-helix (wHTH) protein
MAADGQLVSTTLDSLLRFDLFELDAQSGQLWRSGVLVDLPPQALRILILLAERPNLLITRQEIKDVLWPEENYGDFDSRLNFAIRKVREALNDNAEQPRYIRTVRKAGYMFIAPVRFSSAAETKLPTVLPAPLRANSTDHASPHAISPGLVSESALRLLLLGSALGIAALAITQALLSFHPRPVVEGISAIEAEQTQEIRIVGHGLGRHAPFDAVGLDTPDLMIGDDTAHWMAALMDADRMSEVTVLVKDWSDTLITLKGFSGRYGQGDASQGNWKLHPGDKVRVRVWNPQYEKAGFGECTVTVGGGEAVCSK